MSKSKNVMLLVPTLAYGGSQRAVCNISRLLQSTHQVYIVTFNGQNCPFCYGGTLVDLNLPAAKGKIAKIIRSAQRVLALRRMRRKLQIDVAIGFTGVANQYVCMLGKKCVRFVSSRGYEDMTQNEATLARQARKYNGVIFNSEDSMNYFVQRHADLAQKCVSIPNCFDLEQLRQDAKGDVDEAYRAFCFEKRVIVAVGRLCDVKCFDQLIESFSRLHNRMENVGLAIIGDGEEMDSLARLTEKMPDVMLTGAKENPLPYLPISDIFVLSSRHEGFPNVVIEAMSVGLPVICTNCRSGPNEILNQTYEADRCVRDVTLCDYGILVPPFGSANEADDDSNNTGQMLADAMELLLTDAALFERYHTASEERARDFSFDSSKEKYLDLLDNAMNEDR